METPLQRGMATDRVTSMKIKGMRRTTPSIINVRYPLMQRPLSFSASHVSEIANEVRGYSPSTSKGVDLPFSLRLLRTFSCEFCYQEKDM